MSRSSHGSPLSGGRVVEVVDGGGLVLVLVLVVEVVGGGGGALDVEVVARTLVDEVDASRVVLDDVDARVVAEVVLELGRPTGADVAVVLVVDVLVVDVVVGRPGRGRVLEVVLVVGVGVSAGVGQLAGTGAARATKRPGSSWRTLPPNTRQ